MTNTDIHTRYTEMVEQSHAKLGVIAMRLQNVINEAHMLFVSIKSMDAQISVDYRDYVEGEE